MKIWVKSHVLNNGSTKDFLTNNLNLQVNKALIKHAKTCKNYYFDVYIYIYIYIYISLGLSKCINCMLTFIFSYILILFTSMNFVRIIDVRISTKYA